MNGRSDPSVMVAAPDGTRWVVEARAGELGVAFLVVRTLGGAEMFRELVEPGTDLEQRVGDVARDIAAGTWTATGASRAGSSAHRWSSTRWVAVWLLMVTPVVALAWLVWAVGGVGAAWPLAGTLVWVAGGLAVRDLRP